MINFGNFHMIYFYRHNAWKWMFSDVSPDFEKSFITHCPNTYIIKRQPTNIPYVRVISSLIMAKGVL